MAALNDLLGPMLQFINSGGPILKVIALLALIMWTLIFERLFFYKGALGKIVSKTMETWESRPERTSWNAHKIRDALISKASQRIDQNLDMIATLVTLCPLLGLLGTVTGMIQVFGAMAATGGGDAKTMAAGVQMATIPTMAGMVAAISGVFGNTFISRIAARENQLLEDHLTMDH